jgi:hypothetical protein
MSGMPTRQARRRRLLPSFGLLVGAALVVSLAGPPAGADPANSLAPGQWIAFAMNPSSPTDGQTVNLSVAGSSGPDASPATAWPGGTWPSSWSANGVTLQQANSTPCPSSNGSCPYTVSVSPGSHDVLFGINVPPGQVQNFHQVWVVPTPTTVPPTTSPPVTAPPGPDPTFTGPPNGQLTGPGQFTFQAKGEPGVTYQWTLSANGATVNTGTGPSYSPPSSIFSQAGTYTLTLTATSAGGTASKSDSVQFVIQPSNPQPPQNNPAPTPQPPAASPGGAAPAPVASPAAPTLLTGLRAVSFVPQLPNFATPTPGAAQPVTVIWLWRPDWFQPSSTPPRTVRTGGRPSAVKRADVSINPRGKGGDNAAPLLAGLAAFGIFGAGWVTFKRRQVRSRLLD